jgi:DNA-binding transcriptional LysR family regulator
MEFRHLRSFIAVAEGLNFTRAAERLHVSQPALSAHIQELEFDLGIQLLERNRRSVKLTPAGEAFKEDAATVLRSLSEAERRAQLVAKGKAGNLRIGFVASAALHLVPSIVVQFRKRHPGVTLDLLNLRTADQIARLEEGTLDAGFLRLPVIHRKLDVLPIHKEPFVVVLPVGHPLASKDGFQPLDVQKEDFLAYGRRWAPNFFDRWVSIFERVGFTPRIVQETGEMSTLLALVAAGLGIAVVPSGLAEKSGQGVVIRRLPARSPLSEIGVAFRSGNENPLVTKLCAVARSVGRKALSAELITGGPENDWTR